ncbi:hypothetical protein MSAN_02335200 [Mycena sanguinolenta]|uniref:Uncharacterized protein n=1 Tax=Mycena sanguinolenta TaxID=230812 RepID=A0A8H7CGM8_9AGAR|nr:hypothetical protein MSAN_02335200 [Mycena sanguinolenta]
MQLGYLSFLSAVFSAATVVIAQEVHGNVTFEVRWNFTAPIETTDIKDAYEEAAAVQANLRIQQAINTTQTYTECLTNPSDLSPAAVYALKNCIVAENPLAFFTLLADDISASTDFWDGVIAQSTTDLTQFVPARTYVRGYYGDALTATDFAEWTLSAYADEVDLDVNPEHYYKHTIVDASGGAWSQILEGWGGVLSSFGTKRTNFTIPTYTIPTFNGSEGGYPTQWAIDSSFNPLLQRIGPKVLPDGQTMGFLHIAVRDVEATATNVSAVEIYSAVWYPPYDKALSADHEEFVTNYLADESHHMVVEIINDGLDAAADFAAASRRRRA